MLYNCTDESVTLSEDQEPLSLKQFSQLDEDLDLKRASAIEVITLEEYNGFLSEAGLGMVTQEEIDKRGAQVGSLKSTVCDAILTYGDVNGDGSVSYCRCSDSSECIGFL